MSKDPVTLEDVKDVAKSLCSPTFAFSLGVGGYYLLIDIVKTEGMMNLPYIAGGIKLISILIVVLLAILTFAWGFVIYLFLQYLIDRGDEDDE